MGTTVFARGAKLLVPAVVYVLTSLPALAQQQKMSVSQAVEYALRHNGEFSALRQERGIHEAARVRAVVLPNPTLDFEAATGALTGSSAENLVALGVSQSFPMAGKREKRLTVAEKELESYRWQLADRERVLRAEVKEALYDVILAEQKVCLADRAVEISRQLLDVTKERLAAGDIPELETDLAKVELARSEGARINALNTLTQSRARLWTTMGVPKDEAPEVAATLDAGPAMTRTLAELQQTAAAARPDLKSLEAESGKGDAEMALAQAERIPDVTAGVVLQREATSIEVGGVEGRDTAYTIGVRLSVPIPVFDRNQAGAAEASARRSSTGSRLSAARTRVEREVAAAYSVYQNSEKVLALYRASILPQLEENLKLMQEAYRIGEVGILAVIEEQKKFIEVNESHLAAQHDYQTALVKLEQATATDLSGGAQ